MLSMQNEYAIRTKFQDFATVIMDNKKPKAKGKKIAIYLALIDDDKNRVIREHQFELPIEDWQTGKFEDAEYLIEKVIENLEIAKKSEGRI